MNCSRGVCRLTGRRSPVPQRVGRMPLNPGARAGNARSEKYILFTWNMCGHCLQLKQELSSCNRCLDIQPVELSSMKEDSELYKLFTRASPRLIVPVLYDRTTGQSVFGNSNIIDKLRI